MTACLAALLLTMGSPAPLDLQPYVLPLAYTYDFASRINGVTYRLDIRVPRSYAASAARYPLVLTLDADLAFPLTATISDKLAARSQLPEVIVVSVAYPAAFPSESQYRSNRTRDYTPFFWPDGGYGPEYQRVSGGGPAFLRVIRDEILPYIDRTVRTVPGERVLVGHSYGGLFAVYAFDHFAAMFDRYLIVSPSLWYGDRAAFKEQDVAAGTALERPTRVYLAVGALEGGDGKGTMQEDLFRFARALTARCDRNLTVEARQFDDETHDSVFAAALSSGLRHLFAATFGSTAPAERPACQSRKTSSRPGANPRLR